MSKAVYCQRGEALDYTNNTNNIIEANTIVVLGTRIGVIGTSILPNETGSVHVEGVFAIPKTESVAISMGTTLYFDGNGITTASGSTIAGYAAADSLISDEGVFVKLLG